MQVNCLLTFSDVLRHVNDALVLSPTETGTACEDCRGHILPMGTTMERKTTLDKYLATPKQVFKPVYKLLDSKSSHTEDYFFGWCVGSC